jgi:hypothetical protein
MESVNIKQNLLKNGKIIRWPKKVVDKNSILEYIAIKISFGKKYTEKEINGIIIENILFDDYVLVSRELIENGYLNRTKDCREYWRIEK